MFVQKSPQGTVTGYGRTIFLPDGTKVTEGDPPPQGWVWDPTFDPAEDPAAVQLSEVAGRVDALLDALGGKDG